MKPSALLAFFFFFLLFAFTTTSAEPVFDSSSDVMINGGKYLLSPYPPYEDGAITPYAIRNEASDSCSLAVVRLWDYNGWTIVISTPHLIHFITTNFPLNIRFYHSPPNVCTNSSTWVVTRSPLLGEPVMLGSAKEFGSSFVDGWFFIKTYDSAKHYYKLVFCEQDKECRDIGEQIDGEKHLRLVVTDKKPLVFQFIKVKENINSDLSMVV